MDRINQLVIEKNSRVGKKELLNILREISYYRPKEEAEKERMRRH
jgi:hypothetical protein